MNILNNIVNILIVLIPTISLFSLIMPKVKSKKLLLELIKNIYHFLFTPLTNMFEGKKFISLLVKIISFLYALFILLIVFSESIMLYNSPKFIISFTIGVTFTTIFLLYMFFILIYYSLNLITDYLSGTKIYNSVFICFFILTFYIIALIINKNTLNIKAIFLIMLLISFIVHGILIKIIFTCIIDSTNLKSVSFKYREYNRYFGILTLLLILLLNLYCEVILISRLTKGWAFCMSSNSSNHVTSYLDLFYYTITTFSTVGYGDIVPFCPSGKAESIIIILSSITFLIIFLGSILSNSTSNKPRRFSAIFKNRKAPKTR